MSILIGEDLLTYTLCMNSFHTNLAFVWHKQLRHHSNSVLNYPFSLFWLFHLSFTLKLISSFDLEQGSQLESNYHPAMILKYDTCKSRSLKVCESNSIHSMDNFSLIRLHGMYTGRFQGKQRVLLVGIIASVYGGPFIAG